MNEVLDLVIHCIDFRYRSYWAQWIDQHLGGQADLIAVAGASKAILDEDSQAFILKQIRIAREIHGVTTVHIVDHLDCRAYGGSDLHTDREAEEQMHQQKLQAAQAVVKQSFPDLTVRCYFSDLNTVIEILNS